MKVSAPAVFPGIVVEGLGTGFPVQGFVACDLLWFIQVEDVATGVVLVCQGGAHNVDSPAEPLPQKDKAPFYTEGSVSCS